MKALGVAHYTLVGHPKRIGVRGNCMGVFIEGREPNDTSMVLNLGLESLEATGVPFPIEGYMFEEYFIVADPRIPKEAYRHDGCFCMGGTMAWDRWQATLCSIMEGSSETDGSDSGSIPDKGGSAEETLDIS